jgi:hypothetical protein
MPVRRWLASRLFALVEPPLREWLEARPSGNGPLLDRVAALEEEKAKLQRSLSMVSGAMDATSAQIAQLRHDLDHTANLARQAHQQSTSAFSMAESAAEGVHSLESRTPVLIAADSGGPVKPVRVPRKTKGS